MEKHREDRADFAGSNITEKSLGIRMSKTYKDYSPANDDFLDDEIKPKGRRKQKGKKKKTVRQEIHEQMIDEGLYGI